MSDPAPLAGHDAGTVRRLALAGDLAAVAEVVRRWEADAQSLAELRERVDRATRQGLRGLETAMLRGGS